MFNHYDEYLVSVNNRSRTCSDPCYFAAADWAIKCARSNNYQLDRSDYCRNREDVICLVASPRCLCLCCLCCCYGCRLQSIGSLDDSGSHLRHDEALAACPMHKQTRLNTD